jgi:hypothetical protein
MKKILFVFVLLLSIGSASAWQVYSASGVSDTSVLVNSSGVPIAASSPMAVQETAPPILQQDLIGNSTYYPNRQRAYVVGEATGINNTPVDMWRGPTAIYVFPTVAQQMHVVSSSANDSAAGTGVRQIHLQYLDANYDPQLEVVTLNGTTPVATVATNILRINIVHSITVGSGGASAGNISVTNTAGTVTYAFMAAGDNIAKQAIYTVPAGKTGYLSHWQGSTGSAAGSHFCQIRVVATTKDGDIFPGVFITQDELSTQNGGEAINFPTPIPFGPKTDVKMQADCDTGSANGVANGLLIGWIE